MTFAAAERLARALLFEGYVLYPYRASSLKNRQRWAFGSLYPRAFAEASRAGDAVTMRTECLVAGIAPRVRTSIRFLQLARAAEAPSSETATFQQAVERRIDPEEIPLDALAGEERCLAVRFPETEGSELAATPRTEACDASVSLTATRLAPDLFRLRVEVSNESDVSPSSERHDAMLRTLVSTHSLFGCVDGRFVSLLEPEPAFASYVAECKNEGTWPILVGTPGQRDTLLSSPIILYDYPKVAAESAGDLFDATEIDEILTLRILTLTEEERKEVRRTDPRARALLERTDALGEQELLRLHGAWRDGHPASGSNADASALHEGDHVVVRPRPHGDVLDLALSGELATIVKVEEDLEGRRHYAVTIDCDPGRDLGLTGQPGHRFFFSADELERVS